MCTVAGGMGLGLSGLSSAYGSYAAQKAQANAAIAQTNYTMNVRKN